ncbi:MAG: PepSY domain-containing protein [Proteobacteria bacterium]|uniref:PepSY domain-containing protein n=1 Tax=Rudaea sp. TaxID=2136325 RepID=UPI0032209AE2|nr:PepSY domain-containing protein [Pseudomonadota bacterium]
MIALRRALRPVHRWVGLTAGLVVVWMALTGIFLVFRKQLEVPQAPELYTVPACTNRVPIDTLATNGVKAYPQGKLDYVRIRTGRDGAARIPATAFRFTDEMFVYLNPCTGEVLGLRHRWGGPFGFVEQLHRFRFMPRGNLIVGTSALLLGLVLVIGGLVLWWPGSWRGVRRALAWNAPRPAAGPAKDISLHRLVGPYVAVIVLFSVLTGLPQSFDWYRKSVYWLTGSTPPGHLPASHEVAPGTPRLPVETIWQKVQATVPPSREVLIHYPQHADDAVEIYSIGKDAPHPNARTLMTVDAFSGETLDFTPYAQTSLGHKLYFWTLSAHMGYVGGWIGQLLLLLGAIGVPWLGYTGIRSWLRRAERDPSRLPRQVRVVRKTAAATNICTFELADPDGAALPAFSAGAHIDVQARDGIVRQYSLCNDPRETHRYLIGVLRTPDSRGGSRALHEEVDEGDLIRIGDPRNHFPLAHGAVHSLLLAGGIGITPILCMAERLANIGSGFRLHYFARSRERAAFVERIERSAFADRTQFHFSEGAAREGKFDGLLAQPDAGTHLYVCGPNGFMDAVLAAAKHAGWREENLHREYFAADVLHSENDTGYTIKLASSGKSYTVGKNDSALDVLAANGIVLPRSCEQGVCGTCLTGVLDGVPDHRDRVLTAEERARNDRFTPCCSRAKSPVLVLDL